MPGSSWHQFLPLMLPDDRKSLSRKSFAIYPLLTQLRWMRTPVRLAIDAKRGAQLALNMYASRNRVPGADACGGERPLAYLILQVEFEH